MRTIAEIGNVYGKLTVVERAKSTGKNTHAKWLCQCECGGEVITDGSTLRKGEIKDCGCSYDAEHKVHIGEVFGRLTVISDAERSNTNRIKCLCRCECGTEKSVMAGDLRSGDTKSCGCWNLEAGRTHGMSHSRTYKTWQGMHQRCYNTSGKRYKNYGGRGILVCEEWMDFANFYKDMGEKPKGLSIDRIDNDKGYSKDNCRWATYTEQNRNLRSNHLLTFNGETKCISAWVEELNVSYSSIAYRVKNWSPERVLSEPVKKRTSHATI